MIRLAFMTDKARVLGASTREGDTLRLQLLPQGLHAIMNKILAAENVAVGRRSYEKFYSSPTMARKDMYVLTRDKNYRPSSVVTICRDYMELVQRFSNSNDELMIPGGAEILKLFTPYARIVDVAETTELVPGDLIFDEWDRGDFKLVMAKDWDGGKQLRYERQNVN